MITSCRIFLRMINLTDKFVQKIKKHVSFSVSPPEPPPENSAVYETMWRLLVELERPQMMAYAFCILEMRLHTQTQSMWMYYLLLTHCNSGCTNAPQCYVIRTSPALLIWTKEDVQRMAKCQRDEDGRLLQSEYCIRIPGLPHNCLMPVGTWTTKSSFTIRQNKTVSAPHPQKKKKIK